MKTSATIFIVTTLTLASVRAASAAPNIYIPLGATNKIQIIDATSHTVVGFIKDVGNAHGLAITLDGRTLVAGSFSEDASGEKGVPPRPAEVSDAEHAKHHAKPTAQAIAKAGTSFVSIIDTGSHKIVRRIAVHGAVHHVAISPDGKFAVTTHPGRGGISAIDLTTFATITTVATGSAPNYAAFSPDGRKVYVSNTGDGNVSEVDVASWSVSRSITAGAGPEHVVLSPDGATLYTNNVADGTASAISLADGRVIRTFAVGAAPHGIDLSDDGTTLFATSKGENKLVAINLVTGNKREVPLGPAPYHLSAVHNDGSLYVSSRAQNRLWIVDQKTLAIRSELIIGGIGHQMAVAAR